MTLYRATFLGAYWAHGQRARQRWAHLADRASSGKGMNARGERNGLVVLPQLYVSHLWKGHKRTASVIFKPCTALLSRSR
jgi:hypothetical protein